MTKLYYAETNGYDMVVADHGNYRAILTDSNTFCVRDNRARAEEFSLLVEEYNVGPASDKEERSYNIKTSQQATTEKIQKEGLILSPADYPDGTIKVIGEIYDKDYIKRVTIEESIVCIGENAFDGCTSLTELKLPDSLQEIQYGAFSGCTNLTKIELPDGLQKIDEVTFCGCTGLTEIKLPNSVQEIGSWAFEGCASLMKIKLPDELQEIGYYGAFKDCTNLKEVIFNKSLAYIDSWAFEGCPIEHIIIGERFRGQLEVLFLGRVKEIKELGNGMLDVTFEPRE